MGIDLYLECYAPAGLTRVIAQLGAVHDALDVEVSWKQLVVIKGGDNDQQLRLQSSQRIAI